MSCVTPFSWRAGYKEPMIYMVIGVIIATLALWKVAVVEARVVAEGVPDRDLFTSAWPRIVVVPKPAAA